jgi:4-amino-4-deoxy-L-arabinose transferase-like glycosyltransferase
MAENEESEVRPEPAKAFDSAGLRLFAIVAAVALAARAVFFTELLHDLPFFLTTVEGFDQHTYSLWAQEIAGGDLLSRARGTFQGGPLYPYMLAVAYALAGKGNMIAGIVMNGLLGAGAAVCAAGMARRLFGWWGGLAAGLLMALNGMQLTYEAMLLMDGVLPALLLGGLWLVVELEERRARGRAVPAWGYVAAGLPFGLAAVGRGNNLLVVVALGAWLGAGALRARSRRRLARAAAFGVGACLLVALPLARNGLVFGEWTLTTNGPVLLYIGNVPGTTGTPHYRIGFEATKRRVRQPSDWLRELARRLREQPGALPANLLRKTALFFNSRDIADNGNYHFVRRYVTSLKTFGIGPLTVWVLGAIGVVLTAHRWRRLVPLYVFGVSFAAAFILVLVVGRYRLPFYGVLAVFGGGVLEEVAAKLRRRRLAKPLAALALIAPFTWAFWPRSLTGVEDASPLLRRTDFVRNAVALLERGREQEAVQMLRDGIRLLPRDPGPAEQLAAVELRREDPAEALRIVESALGRGLVSQGLLEERVLALRALGMPEEARRAAVELLRRHPESKIGRRYAAGP